MEAAVSHDRSNVHLSNQELRNEDFFEENTLFLRPLKEKERPGAAAFMEKRGYSKKKIQRTRFAIFDTDHVMTALCDDPTYALELAKENGQLLMWLH